MLEMGWLYGFVFVSVWKRVGVRELQGVYWRLKGGYGSFGRLRALGFRGLGSRGFGFRCSRFRL